MSNQIRGLLIPTGGNPEVIYIDPENMLKELQGYVGGLIDVLSIRADGIDYIINDEGLFSCVPNRAIYADEYLHTRGYASQLTGMPLEVGELFTILFGDIVCLRNNADGDFISLTDQDIDALILDFSEAGASHAASGVLEVLRIKQGGGNDE